MRLAGVCMRHLRRHAVGYLALFVALGGSSYAALSLPKNSVGTPQIRNKAVTLGKISKRTRRSLRGEQGPQGAQGAQGAQGGQGPAGAPGPTASAFGVATIASEFGLTTSDQTAVDLGASADTDHSGPLVASFPARIVATGGISIFKPTSAGDVAGQAFCHLEIGDGSSFTTIGQTADETFEKTDVGQVVFRQVALTAAADMSAGTYQVRVRCSRRNLATPPALNAALTLQTATLTVVAAAR